MALFKMANELYKPAHFSYTPLLYIVDDDEDDKQLLRIALRHFLPEAVITSFSDGKEVLADLSGGVIKAPDLIILDLNMPLVCGPEVLRWLRQRSDLSNIPVVIFSTSRSAADKESCRLLGASDYLCKPSEIAGYEEIAKVIFDRWFKQKA